MNTQTQSYTLPAAKKLVAAYLAEHGFTYTRLTATTAHYYTRPDRVWVTIHGWPMVPADLDLCAFGDEHGITIDFARGER